MKILGAVIAGGLSRRMGQEKAFVMLDGVCLLERVLSRLRFQVQHVVINSNSNPDRFKIFGCDVVADQLQDINTPLAGLHAVLQYGADHDFDAVVTVPTDCPFLPFDLVERLTEGGARVGAAVASSCGQKHYLTGIWTTAMAAAVEKLVVSEGLVRLQDFVSRTQAEPVVWSSVPHDPFFNINTPEDLARAEIIVRGGA